VHNEAEQSLGSIDRAEEVSFQFRVKDSYGHEEVGKCK